MTAGHNIFSQNQRVTSINVIFSDQLRQNPNFVIATGNQLFVSPEYEKDPENDVEDYGLIVLEGTKRGGYAFSALITDAELKNLKTIYLAGYPTDGDKQLQKAGGNFNQIDDKQLSYGIETKPGMSGGPVWVDYLRLDTVIGIQ